VVGETAEIGDDVTLYHGVTLGGTTWRHVKRHPTVGDRVIIGAGATLLGPISVGADSVVGAGAVVIRDAPAHSLVVGMPATARPRDPTDVAAHNWVI
jgi:serine O-acetyltransferase